MNIDHIGIAVKDIYRSIAYWEKIFGYTQKTKVILNTRQKVFVVFLGKESSIDIKLIQPSDESSSVTNFIKRGGSLHHLCFRTNNLQQKIIELKDEGLRSLVKPQPGEAFNNNLIAFLFAKDNMNIELIDTDVRAEELE